MPESNQPNGRPMQVEPEARAVLADCLTHLRVSILFTIVMAVVVCAVYPAIVWGLAQTLFHHQANGSLIKKDGGPADNDADAVGSSLLGQAFASAQYFHPRPSAAGGGYDPTASSGSNLGPTSDKLLNGLTAKDDKGVETLSFDGVRLRTLHYALDNNITFSPSVPLDKFKDKDGNLDDIKLVNAFHDAAAPLVLSNFSRTIPADAVTASGSGLDPHISIDNAMAQTQRVAGARNIPVEKVNALVAENTDAPDLGVLGDAGVNVLKLNLALDRAFPASAPTTAPAH